MKNLFSTVVFISFIGIFLLMSCSENTEVQELSPTERLENNSPWVTTAIYKVENGIVDKSVNYISDSTISNNTISSASQQLICVLI